MKLKRPQNPFLMDETFIANQESAAFRCKLCNFEVESINRISISTCVAFVARDCWCLHFWIFVEIFPEVEADGKRFCCTLEIWMKIFGQKREVFLVIPNPTDL